VETIKGGGGMATKLAMKIFKNDKFKLSAKQIRAIELLISCELNQTEIADECKVTEKTIYNWIHHNEEFRNACEWYRKEIYKGYAPKAVETVVDIMLNGESDKVRLAAAQDILSRAGDNAIAEVDLKSENEINVNVTVI
jgi:predicted DNA-binding protein YlxM (UPF0122 family)